LWGRCGRYLRVTSLDIEALDDLQEAPAHAARRRHLAHHVLDQLEVDIEAQPDAADFVMKVNNGNQTVPTVLFPDGSAATNPSLAEVKARLAAA
jgi:mycoredoxin